MTRAAYWLWVIVVLFPLNFSRGADLECSVGDVAPDRPYVFTTDEQISRACDRINAKTQPFYTSYAYTILLANVALDAPAFSVCESRPKNDPTRIADDDWNVYCGPNHETFFRHMTFQGKFGRDLAVAFQVTGDARYADRAIEILDGWARQALRYPHSGVDDCGSNNDRCYHATGLVLGEAAVVFGDVYALVYERMSSAERARILDMIASYEHFIHVSRGQWVADSYYGNQLWNNHLSAHNMGLVAIGYLTGDVVLKNYAINSAANVRDFREMINGAIIEVDERNGITDRLYYRDPSNFGAPQPIDGEIYDRYRIISEPPRGNNYAALHTRFLATTAEIIIANGQTNYWPYVAPGGENLRWVFEAYSALVSTGDVTAGTGYYAKDEKVQHQWLFLYELAANQWPGDDDIIEPLISRPRVMTDPFFGVSFVLTHGKGGLSVPWKFDTAGRLQGWTPQRSLSGTVSGGTLNLTVNGIDPQLWSPNELRLPYYVFDEVRIGMKNSTADRAAQLFFRTNQAGEENFSESKSFPIPIVPNDTRFRIYTIPLVDPQDPDSPHPKWTGSIQQLRLDVVNSATDGQVQIAWIHLYKNGTIVHR